MLGIAIALIAGIGTIVLLVGIFAIEKGGKIETYL
jgi:hypothetical protein